MLQSEKKLKARHREKNYFKRPRSTQDLIPVDTVYPDGMFLSNGNLYSKSYRFSDINYQIAGQAEKEGIIRDMRALAKGCTPGEMSQITIVNRHINRELLERLQYPPAGDGLDELRGEMNGILESQAGRGTGIIQERYFTASVSKSTPKEAGIHFDRVGTELALGFANMGSKLAPVDLSGRLRILHDFYRPGDENYWHFDFEDKRRKRHSFKDSIAPMSFLPAPDYFKIGSRYVRVLAMTEYASWIYDDTVKELINLDTEMILSVNFLPVPTEESVKYYTKKLDSLEADSMRFQQKQLQRMQIAPPEPYHFRKDRDAITDSLNDIIQKDLGLVVATVTLAHMADSLEQLDSDTELIRNVTRGKNCEFNICTEQQLDALNTVLPYGLDRISMDRSLTTETLAAFVPFSAQEICDSSGVLYGQNAVTRNLVVVDRLAKSSGNGFVLGMTGGGKSFFCKNELVSLRLKYSPDNIDTGNSLICYSLSGLRDQMKPIGTLITLDHLLGRVMRNYKAGKITFVYADEFALLFQDEDTGKFFSNLWRRIRKYNGYCTGATQNCEEVLASESGRAMLSNTDFVVMLNQSPSNAQQLSELYKITENQRTYFTNTQPGHGLMKIGGAMIPFISTVPTDTKLYRMLSTNPREGKWD